MWETKTNACDAPGASSKLIDLLADHCCNWEKRSEMRYVAGYYTSESVMSWNQCAYAYDKVPDMPYTLEDFPLVQLQQPFLHKRAPTEAVVITEHNIHLVDEFGNLPTEVSSKITKMNLQELMSTLNGLEWTVFSDVFREERSDKWWYEVMTLFERAPGLLPEHADPHAGRPEHAHLPRDVDRQRREHRSGHIPARR